MQPALSHTTWVRDMRHYVEYGTWSGIHKPSSHDAQYSGMQYHWAGTNPSFKQSTALISTEK